MQKVDVINTALGFLGKEPVADLSEVTLETSVAATKLLRSIEAAREAVLLRHGWLCALQYATLPQAVIPNYSNWRYPLVYFLPGDALRVWEIAGNILDGRPFAFSEIPWELGAVQVADAARKVIRVGDNCGLPSADGSLNVAYVCRANWQALDGHLCDAIAAETAWRQCVSITGDKAAMTALGKQKEDFVQLAIGKDATQTGGQPAWAPSIPAQIRRFAGAGGGWPDWR